MRTVAHLQVKNVPDAVHEELRRRAARRGLSQSDYVLGLLEADQAKADAEDWESYLDSRPPLGVDSVGAADMLREQRAVREKELVDRHRRVRGG